MQTLQKSCLSIIFTMKPIRIIGLSVLLLVWLWLCRVIVVGGGFTLRTVFLIVASGIIIFVPLWRKYVAPEIDKKNKK